MVNLESYRTRIKLLTSFHRGQDLLASVLCRDRRNFLALIQTHLKQAYENVVMFKHRQHQMTQHLQATELQTIVNLSGVLGMVAGRLQALTIV